MKKNLNDIDVLGKIVLLRVDFNVPIRDKKVINDKRITAALPTINYLIKKNARIVLFSHLGRIKTEEDKIKNSLKPVAAVLASHLKKDVKFIAETRGKLLEDSISNLKNGELLMFENTRFEDLNNSSESKNDMSLGKYWAGLGDVFINDAFGTAHRAHASNVGIASNINESGLGFLVNNEIEMLTKAVSNPKKPVVSIVGGAKVSDKINVIESLMKISDKVILCGGMAFTFWKAMGYEIGNSLVEDEKLGLAKEYIKKYGKKLILPIDSRSAEGFKDIKANINTDMNVPSNEIALDIGPASEKLFANILNDAKTVIWNGPAGVFEFKNFSKGTEAICKKIATLKNSFTVIGGGDSATAAISLGFENNFSHISTGGGASLEFFEGKELPGIKIIQDRK